MRACCDCFYWDITGSDDVAQSFVGRCRRHAPKPQEAYLMWGGWPQTRDNDWCGEFVADGPDTP